jgi:DNA-binding MarR family transcriptional regulator
MDETNSRTPDGVARRFFEVIPPLWQSMTSVLRSGAMEEGHVSFPQMRAMAILRHHSASLNDLAKVHEVSPATMSRMISTLVDRGWVQRDVDKEDRRQVRLTLTDEGIASMDAIGARSVDYLAELMSDLTDLELTELERSLTALARIVAARRNSSALKAEEA